MVNLNGSIVALVTPMLADGSIDFASLEKLVEYHINAGTDAIVSVGTTGESATLNPKEHIEVVMQTVKFANGRIPIIAGTGSNCTRDSITMTKNLKDAGIVACLSVVPYYNKPTQEGMYQHYKAITEQAGVDLILYNVPSRTGSDLKPETVGRLAKLPHIIGIKEATGDVSRVKEIRDLTSPDFLIVSGDDASSFEFMRLGGNGVISVANNVIAEDFAKMCHLTLAGDFTAAAEIDKRYQRLFNDLFVESNPIPVKWVCYKLGLIASPSLRLPLIELSAEGQKKLQQVIKQLGL